MRAGRPRFGLTFRVGPFRAYLPLHPARTRRVQVFTHAGCAVQHGTYRAASQCPEGDQ